MAGHTSFVHAVAFSRNGKVLATGSRDFTIKLWDPFTGTALGTLGEHAEAVRTVAFSPDDQTLVSGGEDGALRWWDLARTQQMASCKVGISLEEVMFSPDGQHLAAVLTAALDGPESVGRFHEREALAGRRGRPSSIPTRGTCCCLSFWWPAPWEVLPPDTAGVCW